MNVVEIQTIEGGRLSWVAIYADSNLGRAIGWGDRLLSGFRPIDLKPKLRILDRYAHEGGKVIGAWQLDGYELVGGSDD